MSFNYFCVKHIFLLFKINIKYRILKYNYKAIIKLMQKKYLKNMIQIIMDQYLYGNYKVCQMKHN